MDNSAFTGIAAGMMGIMAGIYGFMFMVYCFVILFALVVFVFWLWMLVDALSRKDYDTENDRLLWCLVVFFGHWIGAIIYFFLVRSKKGPAFPISNPVKK
jgi:hypothetical protein